MMSQLIENKTLNQRGTAPHFRQMADDEVASLQAEGWCIANISVWARDAISDDWMARTVKLERAHKPEYIQKALDHIDRVKNEHWYTFTAHKHGRDIQYVAQSITNGIMKVSRVENGIASAVFEYVFPKDILVHTIKPTHDVNFSTTLDFTRRAYRSAVYTANNKNGSE